MAMPKIFGLSPSVRSLLEQETQGLSYGYKASLTALVQEGFPHIAQLRACDYKARDLWIEENVTLNVGGSLAWRRRGPFIGFCRPEDAVAFGMRWC